MVLLETSGRLFGMDYQILFDAVISILQRAKYINFTSKSEQQKTE